MQNGGTHRATPCPESHSERRGNWEAQDSNTGEAAGIKQCHVAHISDLSVVCIVSDKSTAYNSRGVVPP